MRFGIVVIPGSPWEAVAEQALRVEELGFDVLMTGDHMRHPIDASIEFLDGWTVLAGWAAITRRVRLAMYVSNLIYRQPALLARQAIAVDHISSGRLDLGIGGGVFDTDHAMAGVPLWTPAERVARMEEMLTVVTRLLAGDTTDYEGSFYSVRDAAISPGPVQRPRPPIVVAAHGPKMLALTARFADVWSTFGGYGLADDEEFYERTSQRSQALDRACEAIGRDPKALERSVLVHHSVFDPWASPEAFERIVARFDEMGIHELIFYWPREDERDAFEQITADLLPRFMG